MKLLRTISTSTVFVFLAFALPYFAAPFVLMENPIYLQAAASLFFGLGSVWWLRTMLREENAPNLEAMKNEITRDVLKTLKETEQ